MSQIGASERVTQNRVVRLFCDELGYRYLGDWSDRPDNSNVEKEILQQYLVSAGYVSETAARAATQLWSEANNLNRELFDSNKAVHQLLFYGLQIQSSVDATYETVKFIDWDEPSNNDFAIAEEVTLRGDNERRPDLVLFVNGIAFAVIELKNSRVSVETGIRQIISNQKSMFNSWFFSTIQLLFAGNDSQGLRYGTVLTPEKFFMEWKEDVFDDSRIKLDKYLLKMCNKDRALELMHDFVLFDAGQKKVPRYHQYFAVKRAQESVAKYQGGIVWHTQGSGKSIVMVLLAKWILRTNPNARVVVVTDRDELDKQIAGVFSGADETILRTSSGADLLANLAQATPRLLCSLIHKFGRRDVEDFDAFITELTAKPAQTVGELFVFVDECHRTQSGRLHKTMKAIIPTAIFVGFTGTPLLKKDRATTRETFGGYIHTYKYREGVEDKVVLDLTYEARDVEQTLGDETKIDEWFEKKTDGLNEWQRAELRSQWGNFQRVRSSKSRIGRIVTDIEFDFATKPLLRAPECLGNAMLIASNIYEACRYYDLFQDTALKGKVALVTSYDPRASDISLEDTGANTETDKEYIYSVYEELLKGRTAAPGLSVAESYRDWARGLFVDEPARMRLLIVVDMCLTGFDPPSCSYEYIDKTMQDHALFQAICRTNRVSEDWKEFGNIVDYKSLLSKVQDSIAVYSSDLDEADGGVTSEVFAQARLAEGKTRLLGALEVASALCENVKPPKSELEHIQYFCGNTEIASDLEDTVPRREALYTAVVALVRAYANISDDLPGAGFSSAEITKLNERVSFFVKLRETIKIASGERLDTKAYEADMRYLIDTYVEANAPKKISSFDTMPLLDIIVKSGVMAAVGTLSEPIRNSPAAVAAVITNNVRSTIVERRLSDPAYYDKMSTLLAQIVAALKAEQIQYAQYLTEIEELAKQVDMGEDSSTPEVFATSGTRALYNNLPPATEEERTQTALRIDATVKRVRQADWRGNYRKEQEIKSVLFEILGDEDDVESVFKILRAQPEY